MQSRKGLLSIFDLGYWDYGLLLAIEQEGGLFLSRVKNGSVLPPQVASRVDLQGLQVLLNADRMTSRNPLIIQNLLLASLAGQLASAAILQFGRDRLPQDRRLAVSFQRTAKIAALLARDFVRCFLEHTSQAAEALSR
jgi:hypothetical protein